MQPASDEQSVYTNEMPIEAGILPYLKSLLFGSRRGIRDVVITMIPQGVRLFCGFVGAVLIARGLGPVGLGQYALILSLSELLWQLSDLGIGQSAVRYAARAVSREDEQGQHAVLRWAFRLRILILGILLLLFYFAAPLLASKIWKVPELTPLLRLGLLTGMFGALSSIPIFYYQSLKRFGVNAAVSSGQSLISLTGILVLAWFFQWTIAKVVTVNVISTGIASIAFLVFVPASVLVSRRDFVTFSLKKPSRFFLFPISTDLSYLKMDETSPGRFTWYLLLSNIIVLVIQKTDVWMIGAMLDKHKLGIYSAAMRFTLPLFMISSAVTTALWPRVAALTKTRGVAAMLKKTFRLSLITAFFGLFYSIFFPMLAPCLFGNKYTGSVLLGQLLCLRYCFSILICPVSVVGYNLGLVRVYWGINLFQLIVVIGFNFLLLTVFGPIASAVALLACDTMGLILVGFFILKRAALIRKEEE